MTTENEIEQEQEIEDEGPSVESMVDNIIQDNNAEAKTDFESLVAAKLADALDAKKVEIARSIYGDEEEEEENDQYEDEQEAESEEEEDER